MNDSDFYSLWQKTISTQAPFEQAIQAGRVAENPALIFIAGYQAAIRATFPELLGDHWYTFAVSEDRSPESSRPGVTLANGLVTGFKTWIAAANHVDQLVLKVGSGKSATYGLVDAKANEVVMDVKDKPGFLPEMSQGQAEFLGAEFTQLKDTTKVGRFHEFEPYFIYVAFLARIEALELDELSTHAEKTLKMQRADNDLVALDVSVSEMLTLLKERGVTLGENWETDQRLFTMYSKGIQASIG